MIQKSSTQQLPFYQHQPAFFVSGRRELSSAVLCRGECLAYCLDELLLRMPCPVRHACAYLGSRIARLPGGWCEHCCKDICTLDVARLGQSLTALSPQTKPSFAERRLHWEARHTHTCTSIRRPPPLSTNPEMPESTQSSTHAETTTSGQHPQISAPLTQICIRPTLTESL